MNGRSSIIDNAAGDTGGGIHSSGVKAVVTLKASSSVTGNTATLAGGGIAAPSGLVTTTLAWVGIVSKNAPDDCEPDGLIPGCV